MGNTVSIKFLYGLGYLLLAGCGGSGGNSGQQPDPVLADLPIAYIQRTVTIDETGAPAYPDIFEPQQFFPGAELYIKARATAAAPIENITRAAFEGNPNFTPEQPNYDVKDVAVHPSGNRLIFALRAPAPPTGDPQPTWNIWEYHRETKILRPIIASDFEAEKGDDVSPRYMPDGRIVFSSSRQTRSKEILLDEGKPQFGAVTQQRGDVISFSLHSMKDDGSDIQQLTFNQSHDLQPRLLADGRIMFMRWEGNNPERFSFYTANPDGTKIERYFGYHSLNLAPVDTTQTTPRLFHVQPMVDGRIAAIYMQNERQFGGDMVVIDPRSAAEGEVQSMSINPVNISSEEISLPGRFASLAPLYDGTNRLLVSWSQCRLEEIATAQLSPCLDSLVVNSRAVAGYREAQPYYGIWIFDLVNRTQQPVVLAETGKMLTDAVALEDLAAPPAFRPSNIDPDLAAQNLGILHIRSLYDFDGIFSTYGVSGAPSSLAAMAEAPAGLRPARFVRVVKSVSVPRNEVFDDQDEQIYGNLFNDQNGIQEILGYAPVEPDGSVKITVPADVAFSLEILDAKGQQIRANHATLLQLRPGETRECNGCHLSANSDSNHGRNDLEAISINSGAAGGSQFVGTTRYDRFGTPMTPEPGETMAEFASRSFYRSSNDGAETILPSCGPDGARDCTSADLLRSLTVDLVFSDEWTSTTADNFAWTYNKLVPGLASDAIAAPTSTDCRADNGWTARCRVIINYEYHIQPLWEQLRPAMTVGELTATSCIGCHTSSANSNGATLVKVPDGQLDLSRNKLAANAHMASYTDLTANDNQQIFNQLTGLLEDELIPNGQCNLDINGNLLVDENGLCTDPVLVPIVQPASMTRGSAYNSTRFFAKFAPTGSHAGYLNPSELKMLSEWLDTNGRYYNNPFELAVPN